MIYVASPYSDPSPVVREHRYECVSHFVGLGLKVGHIMYSPIVHCHEIALKQSLPTDAEFWGKYNFGMLRLASELLVLCLPGWEVSKGVAKEIKFAEVCGINVEYAEWQL